MKVTMKIICLYLITALTCSAGEIKELDGGSCWFQETNDGVKVSSFNSKVSVKLDNGYLSSLSNFKLPVNFDGSYNSQLHCSTHGVSLVMNVQENSKKYCLWFNIEKDGLAIHSVGRAQYSERCDGYKEGVIHINLEKQNSAVDVKSIIEQSIGIEKVEIISEKFLSVHLSAKHFDDQEKIEKELLLLEEVKSVEKSHFVHPIGEWGSLESLRRE